MNINKFRKIVIISPITKKQRYFLNCEEPTRDTVNFTMLTDGILEQIKLCVDEKGGLFEGDCLQIDVNVKYIKNIKD